uniref:Uncharacterized protein n=1 Tax=Arundo donax TaxID=35708 RepID=A0A0A9B444_ARUDO
MSRLMWIYKWALVMRLAGPAIRLHSSLYRYAIVFVQFALLGFVRVVF